MSIKEMAAFHNAFSQLNTSKANHTFSFPKSDRLPKTNKGYCMKSSYEIGSTIQRKGSFFGTESRFKEVKQGIKLEFKDLDAPSPHHYKIPRIEAKSPQAPAFSFGTSRAVFEKVFLEN
jgi:hypothetical protein